MCSGSLAPPLSPVPNGRSVRSSGGGSVISSRGGRPESRSHGLTGRREFWSLELEVDRFTLVPRPETERLVEAVLAALGEMSETEGGGRIRVADLGTGCGALAIAIVREADGADVVATEIDPEALAVARRNARRLAPGRVELRLGSWCESSRIRRVLHHREQSSVHSGGRPAPSGGRHPARAPPCTRRGKRRARRDPGGRRRGRAVSLPEWTAARRAWCGPGRRGSARVPGGGFQAASDLAGPRRP